MANETGQQNSPKISAIIMAAGYGKRMQEAGYASCNKLLMNLGNTPVYQYLFTLLQQAQHRKLIHKVYLITAENTLLTAAEDHGFIAIKNTCPSAGKSQSILQGVCAADPKDALMFFVADQPLLSLQSVEKLVQRYCAKTQCIVYPQYKGKPANPVIFPPQARSFLMQLSGDIGGKQVFAHFNTDTVEIFDPWEVFDMDTPADYLKLQKHIMPPCTGPVAFIRGAGDIASGVIQALVRAGFRVLALELETPLTIRRTVAYSEAVYQSYMQVEDVTARLCHHAEELRSTWKRGECAVMVDPHLDCLKTLPADCLPQILIDASLAKRDIGTRHHMAPLTLALGPGYYAGAADNPLAQVDAVIETMRGHDLGRLICEGSALANTGVPGDISGYSKERVIHAPASGTLHAICKIGDIVSAGQVIGSIDDLPFYASINGVLRGYLKNGLNVHKGLKIADIDPRGAEIDIHTISDKARNLGGSCLQAIFLLMRKKGISTRL